MSRLGSVMVALVGFATVNTIFAALDFRAPSVLNGLTTSNVVGGTAMHGGSALQPLLFLLPTVQFLS